MAVANGDEEEASSVSVEQCGLPHTSLALPIAVQYRMTLYLSTAGGSDRQHTVVWLGCVEQRRLYSYD